MADDYKHEAVTQAKTKAIAQGCRDIIFKHNDAFNLSAFASREADILVSSGFFNILKEHKQIKRN